MYQALYRKYRPKTFDDVCGQSVITATLKNEIAGGRASHAYLFTGLRGSGKTTCSKIIAKAVNCLNPHDGNPCCACEICTGIDNDAETDVMEIDAASNSGVDYMRELREQAFYQPVRCKKRVYIIDETHMLSTEAFNALLKIMEEPPEHVLFILATTEVHKVPATIVSRCQRFDFKRIAPEDIADRLGFIAQSEGFSVEREAALMIARLADGGMRDAISLLDLCWSRASAIDLQVVADCAGLSRSDTLFALSERLAAADCPGALLTVGELAQSSADLSRVCEQLVAHMRNLMVARCTDRLEELIVCLPAELEQYRACAKLFSVERLLAILHIFQDTLARMGRTANKRAELETAVVRICCAPAAGEKPAAEGADVDALAGRVARLERAVQALGQGAAPAAAPPMAAEPPAFEPAAQDPAAPRKPAVPFGRWNAVMEKLQDKNKALYGALVGSRAFIADDLILIQSKNELFLKLIRENEYTKQNLHECIIEVTGRRHRLGPYREQLYSVSNESQEKPDPLEEVLKAAGELGVDVTVTGEPGAN